MIVKRGFSLKNLLAWSGHHILWLSLGASGFALLYHYQIMTCTIPWLPVSVIGTAVAFYVGFKNNSAYERLWEARKIWGGIVNSSRTWGMFVDGFINNLFAEKKYSEGKSKKSKSA
jgi:putative membrane protein